VFFAKTNSVELRALGEPISVAVRESNKARRISICVRDEKVELILPYGAPKNEAYKFLLTKERWIREKFMKVIKIVQGSEKLPDQLFILGKMHDVHYVHSSNEFAVTLKDECITVYSPKDHAGDVLKHYLQQYILDEISRLAKLLAKENGFRYSKISVKELKTRWGSCSSLGNLSFNWRIIFAPHSVLQYLIVHELCHLKEMNHGPKFWKLVEKIFPNYRMSMLWLKKNGKLLYNNLSVG
jgi:predicted metal-dependent hydrolase